MKRLATIDLGSNTVRLLVVETDGAAWRPVAETQRVTRLGEGQFTAGRLGEAPMGRTLAVVSDFAAQARRQGAERLRIVATSAVREAVNREEFVSRVAAATGERVEVVSGEDEARLTLLGVSAALPALRGAFMLFDIGGGSTEFVLARDGRPAAAVSLRLGVVPLAEEFVDSGPVSAARWQALNERVAGRLERELPVAIARARAPVLVGTAGTVTTLAALDLGLAAYDAARVHGHVLSRRAVDGLRARLCALSVAERAQLPCLEPGRADVIIPGIAICLGVLAVLGHDSLVVSDRGLREGILVEMLGGR
ncbi:MAG TPA: Ppx/GppA phosphatase family protein [Methylomirabilota bacterium]|nr:Ppx/GppA phosphatase family protein [Methylomirabilota bacterium]